MFHYISIASTTKTRLGVCGVQRLESLFANNNEGRRSATFDVKHGNCCSGFSNSAPFPVWRHSPIKDLVQNFNNNTPLLQIKRVVSHDEKSASNISNKGFGKEPSPSEAISLNFVQRSILSIGAAATALLDPRRHDMVATLGETTGHRALVNILKQMKDDPEGRDILKERPRISSRTVDLAALRTLPEGTLGWGYIKFLDDNQVTPDSRSDVKFVQDDELRYVMQRYREVHDLFHSVLGMPTNMLGEVAVKWVEAMQTGLPMCGGAAVFGPLRFRPKQRRKYVDHYLPWALKVGKESKPLMNVYYEKRWQQPIDELRKELNIEPFSEN